MKLKQIINDTNFQNARIITYIIIFIFYIYLAYFINFQCIGCPLCGMTRAIKSLLILNFPKAFEYNPKAWIFCMIIPLIILNIIVILHKKILIKKNIYK